MKVKLDENLGRRGEQLLVDSACDVSTVVSQQLCSVSDITLIEVCRAEGRVLIVDSTRIREFAESDDEP